MEIVLNSSFLRTISFLIAALNLLGTHNSSLAQTAAADPYLWLEEVTGEKALDFVKQNNQITLKELQNKAQFAALQEKNTVYFGR